MYEFEASFTDISGSNGLILIKFSQLFQWVIQSLNTRDFNHFIKLLILDFNWYSDLLGP